MHVVPRSCGRRGGGRGPPTVPIGDRRLACSSFGSLVGKRRSRSKLTYLFLKASGTKLESAQAAYASHAR